MKFEILAAGELEPDFASRQIERSLGTDYSHAAILVDDLWIYHATAQGLHMTSFKAFALDHAVRRRFSWALNEAQSQFALGWLQGALGHKYAESQHLGPFFSLLRPLVISGQSKTVCAEPVGQFIFDCLRVQDARLYACDYLSPKDIVEICDAAQRHG